MALGELAAVAVTIGAVTKPLDNALKKVKADLGNLASKPTNIAKIGSGLARIGEGLKKVFEGVTLDIAAKLGHALSVVFQGLKSTVTAIFRSISTAVASQFGTTFKKVFSGITTQLKTSIGKVFSGIGDIFGGLKDVLGGIIGAIASSLSVIFSAVSGVLVGALKGGVAGFMALAGASFFAAKQAASLEMEMHRNKEIFGQLFPMVNQTIASLSKTFGYTRAELADMSANLGLMFVGMGMNSQMTAQLASNFLKLGTDASILYGMELPEFMNRLEAGIAGANKGLHKMGIFIDETKTQFEKTRLAGLGFMWVTEEQGDQMARTSLIMKGLSRAAGQARWVHQQFGGTLRETQGRISEMWVTFGEAVKPAWTRIIMKVNEVLKSMGEWLDRNKAVIKSWANYIADILIFVVDHWKELLVAMGEVARNAGKALFGGMMEVPGMLRGMLGSIVEFFMSKFRAVGEIISSSFGYAFGLVKTMLSNFKDNAIAILDHLWNSIKSGFLSVISKILWGLSYLEKPFKMFANSMVDIMNWAVRNMSASLIPIMDLMVALGRMDKETASKFKVATNAPIPKMNEDVSVLAEFSNKLGEMAAKAAEEAAKAIDFKDILAGAPAFPAVDIARAIDKLMALPMPNLRGFMDAMRAAGVDVVKWMDPLNKVFDKFKLTKAQQEKKQKEELGRGMQNPLMPEGRGRAEGGFVAITDMWKNIQTGANSRDAAVLATARNTQRMAEMIAMFGPRMMDVLMMAGGAGP